MPSNLRARQGSDPQKLMGQLEAVLEVEREFEKSRCEAYLVSTGAISPSIAPDSCWRYFGFLFFGCYRLDPREDFIRRQHPIHWN